MRRTGEAGNRRRRGVSVNTAISCDLDATKRDHMTNESDHTANLRKARERLVEDRRQLAADLAKPFKRGDERKRELFTAIQSAIDAIDRAIEDERKGLSDVLN